MIAGERTVGMAEGKKPRILVDFDGVVHSYDSGWKGVDQIPDPPVPGAFEFLSEALDRLEVCIYSSRTNEPGGVVAMRAWFLRHGFERLEELQFPTVKPPAIMTIDDRAFRFEGTFPSIEEILSFRTWQQRLKV